MSSTCSPSTSADESNDDLFSQIAKIMANRDNGDDRHRSNIDSKRVENQTFQDESLSIKIDCLEKVIEKQRQMIVDKNKMLGEKDRIIAENEVDLLASINNASIERRTTNYAVDERSTKEIINDLTMQNKEKDRQLAIANQRSEELQFTLDRLKAYLTSCLSPTKKK